MVRRWGPGQSGATLLECCAHTKTQRGLSWVLVGGKAQLMDGFLASSHGPCAPNATDCSL